MQEAKYDCARVWIHIHAAHFHIRVSCKVLSGASDETGFRECAALLFRAEAAALGQVGAERSEMLTWRQMQSDHRQAESNCTHGVTSQKS